MSTSAINPNGIIGTWFSTGYHGHFRNSVRLDFMNEYRLAAKPRPPRKFSTRSAVSPAKHVFSTHDNRHALISDALYFEQGLGRRRVRSRASNPSQAELLLWKPHENDFKTAGPQTSVYRKTFTHDFEKGASGQRLINRPKSSFDRGSNSMYRSTHGGEGRNVQESITTLNTGRQLRPKTANPNAGQSVATCMSWHVPRPPHLPESTGVTLSAAEPQAICTQPE